MLDHRPSLTAAFVAACRGLSPMLPAEARLIDDPIGLRFAGPALRRAAGALLATRGAARVAAQAALLPVLPWVIYMQVRTRAIDEALLTFVADGGAQVVILGAGFDARAVRLADRLRGARVIEVDHPATQSRKTAELAAAGVTSAAALLAWDFERDALADLPARLAALGHDASRPTLTVWEGVTMYLSADALSATVDAVAAYSAPGSRLVFNYVRAELVDRPGALAGAVALVVRSVGEPFRSGFDPEALPGWLAARGFRTLSDDDFDALATRWLPRRWSRAVRRGRRLAVTERTAVGERIA
jgi:methyltransferase (TIGR00027 family)